MRMPWLKSYLYCAYCGRLLSWKWKWCGSFDKHRTVEGACPCEAHLSIEQMDFLHKHMRPHRHGSNEPVLNH